MKYYKTIFHISAPEGLFQDAIDITSALAGEAGFESFEDCEEGLCGYVQQPLFDRSMLEQLLSDFPLPSCNVTFSVEEAEYRDWNEQWEEEGFEPIVVSSTMPDGSSKTLVIHDGRHLPSDNSQLSVLNSQFSIEIDAKMAFGTGTHETTRMIVGELLNMDLSGKHVLDCGTGTGILSIVALKLGAAHATGYDIDEWSADNARHNAVINRVDERFTSLLGDATLLDALTTPDGSPSGFDLVLANINRNILLADMPRFRQQMRPGATLILSGFYTSDVPLLTEKAQSLGLKVIKQNTDDNWTCLVIGEQ